jgi:(aminoalkyl)phosphonate N-acetyltransferase
MLTIRRANEMDLVAVHRLMEKLEEPQKFPVEAFQKTYQQNLADPGTVYLVAEQSEGTEIVAFGSLAFHTPLHHAGPVAEVVELVVDEPCRGQSIGEQLINAMLMLARDRDCCVLEVDSNRMRDRAHQFYLRHGFDMTHCKLTMDLRT